MRSRTIYLSGVVDRARCFRPDGTIEVIACRPPVWSVGAIFKLYSTDGVMVEAEYFGYGQTGRLPTMAYFRALHGSISRPS